jgi:hypothetical protein
MDIGMKSWRDTQLKSTQFLKQELPLIEFLSKIDTKGILWLGNKDGLYAHLSNYYPMVETAADTCVLYGNRLLNKNIIELQDILVGILADMQIKCIYVGINRYALTSTALYDNTALPDSIEESLDMVMKQCHPGFKRIEVYEQVDGNHFVYSHPMDNYTLCR